MKDSIKLLSYERNGCQISSCSTQPNLKFVLLIGIAWSTTVGLLIFIDRINFVISSAEQRVLIFGFLISISMIDFMLSWVEDRKSFISFDFDAWFHIINLA